MTTHIHGIGTIVETGRVGCESDTLDITLDGDVEGKPGRWKVVVGLSYDENCHLTGSIEVMNKGKEAVITASGDVTLYRAGDEQVGKNVTLRGHHAGAAEGTHGVVAITFTNGSKER